MTIPRNIVTFQTASTLSPTKLNKAWNRLGLDLVDTQNQKFCYSNVQLDFTGVKDTSAAEELVLRVKPPFKWEVVAIELISYGAANVTSVSIASSMTNWRTLSSGTLTTGTKVVTTDNFLASGAANTEVTFTLAVTSTGAFTLGRTYVNILIRATRDTSSNLTYKTSDVPRVASGDTVSASVQNTGFTNYETGVTNSSNATKYLSFMIFQRRNIGTGTIPASDADRRLASKTRRVDSIDVLTLAPVGKSLQQHLRIKRRLQLLQLRLMEQVFLLRLKVLLLIQHKP